MAFLKPRSRRLPKTNRQPSLLSEKCLPLQEEPGTDETLPPTIKTALQGEAEGRSSLSDELEELPFEDDDAAGPASCSSEAPLQTVTCTAPSGKTDRLDRFLCAQPGLDSVSRERVKQAIRAGQCQLDGIVCNDPSAKVKPGQNVSLTLTAECSTVRASEGPLECLYADKDLAVVNKPPHLAVHPCPSCTEETLVHRLLYRFPQLAALGGERPGIVHRLDKDTSGLLLVALTENARLRLSADFANRAIHKVYLALVHGMPPEHGSCDAPLGRHPTVKVKMAVCPGGRDALTEWQRLYTSPDGAFSLLAIRLHTGRTHQIRVHMQHMGYPLFGDPLYGGQRFLGAQKPSGSALHLTAHARTTEPACCTRQMLHAWRLHAHHPITGHPLTFRCDPPDDFQEVMRQLHARMPRLVVTGCPGCGKSALTHALGALGFPTWSADADVAALYAPDGEVTGILRLRWGDRFVNADGSVNKQALLESMRLDPSFRHELETIVHRFVYAALERFWETAAKEGAPLAVAEVPLWFESSPSHTQPAQDATSDELFVAGIACDRQIRHERLRQRRGWSEDLIALMDSWQWPEEKKMAACDIVIDNSRSLEELEAQATTLAKDIQARAAQRQQSWQVIVRQRLDQLHNRLTEENNAEDTEEA